MRKRPLEPGNESAQHPGADRFAKITALLQQVLPGARKPPAAAPANGAPHTSSSPVRPSTRRRQPAGDGAFSDGVYANESGQRAYKLFVPTGYTGQPIPLVVMLHGCTQSADDFAIGTRMNVVAQEQTFMVVYPEQPGSANASRCWNWFNPRHQQRGAGEPSIIVGITRRIMRDYAVDPRQVYVAGLSAGAAEAVVLGTTYPDVYAAIGVHSGLPYGIARNVPAAFSAMRNGPGQHARASLGASTGPDLTVPTIIFHGDRDTTVHPSNADAIIGQHSLGGDLKTNAQSGAVPGGRTFTRTQHADADGVAVFEQWVIHGGGHAWSGGSSAGSYTDPLGPDASREMARFFLTHRRNDVARSA